MAPSTYASSGLTLKLWTGGDKTLTLHPSHEKVPLRQMQAADAAAEAAGTFATRVAIDAGLTLDQVAEEACFLNSGFKAVP